MATYINSNYAVNTTADILNHPFDDNKGDVAPYSVTTDFLNGLADPVTVVRRDGLPVRIPSMLIDAPNCFIIRVTYAFTPSVIIDIDRLSNATCPTSIALRDRIQSRKYDQNGFRTKRFSIYYTISKEQIQTSGGSLYFNNLDIVISTMQGDRVPRHPLSMDGIRDELVGREETINTVGSFGYAIQIIDNAEQIDKRYINVNNEVFVITPTKDPLRLDGAYIARTSPIGSNGVTPEPTAKHYKPEEIDESLRLYRTAEEARMLGDISAEYQREHDLRKRELDNAKTTFATEKLVAEKELETQKRIFETKRLEEEDQRRIRESEYKRQESHQTERLSRLKEEIAALEHRRSMEAINRKDHYEERSYVRKDSSEMIKWLPGLVGAGVALFLALR